MKNNIYKKITSGVLALALAWPLSSCGSTTERFVMSVRDIETPQGVPVVHSFCTNGTLVQEGIGATLHFVVTGDPDQSGEVFSHRIDFTEYEVSYSTSDPTFSQISLDNRIFPLPFSLNVEDTLDFTFLTFGIGFKHEYFSKAVAVVGYEPFLVSEQGIPTVTTAQLTQMIVDGTVIAPTWDVTITVRGTTSFGDPFEFSFGTSVEIGPFVCN